MGKSPGTARGGTRVENSPQLCKLLLVVVWIDKLEVLPVAVGFLVHSEHVFAPQLLSARPECTGRQKAFAGPSRLRVNRQCIEPGLAEFDAAIPNVSNRMTHRQRSRARPVFSFSNLGCD